MYNHLEIEKKWQKFWLENKIFKTTNQHDKKYYVLDMFPYPSGQGLHVGHPMGYLATDIIARFKRYNNFDVLHPIGWDAFGLPAEQYALSTGNHPKDFTLKNVNNFRKQLQSLGFSYDYDKEVNTTDKEYYKWTQWIFAQLYKNDLAKLEEIEVNWCEGLKTVLANEEVLTLENGDRVSERGNFPVEKRKMKQWVLKITKYAEILYADLDKLDWPESLKNLQKNWIKNPDGSLHLRDWVFARQRYWGEPFPIAYDKNGQVKLIEDFPIELPELEKIEPSKDGFSPLENAKDWMYFEIDGQEYVRDTNTMPQWAGSSWYYLAYVLKNPDQTFIDLNSEEAFKLFEKWLPVDLYIGGQEHAVLHLLYARFWHKFLFDIKVVPTDEPFQKVVNQGMLLGSDGHKMSKSKGNVLNPDNIINQYGADTLRVYQMFMGPVEDTKIWSDQSLKGVNKWIKKVYNLFIGDMVKIGDSLVTSEYQELLTFTNENIENLKFNTIISQMMVFINSLTKKLIISEEELIGFSMILSCFAPHLAEEILAHFNLKTTNNYSWPKENKDLINQKTLIIVIQINGKVRSTINTFDSLTKEQVLEKVKQDLRIQKILEGKQILKIIYVQDKIINFVIK